MPIPGILFEDEHLLVVNKPAGMNTHAPAPFAGEGIYEWLRDREPRWAGLAIIHRLDKDTSGVMVFGKTKLANQSLTVQFTTRAVHKRYVFLTDQPVRRREILAKSHIARAGAKYVSGAHGQPAETRFRLLDLESPIPNLKLVSAEPLTGRTHQIRVHAAENGFAVLGDALYGGAPFHRLCLHAVELSFRHPATGRIVRYETAPDFFADARLALRTGLVDLSETDAFRAVHGAADGWPSWYVDRLGNFFLSQSPGSLDEKQLSFLRELIAGVLGNRRKEEMTVGAYHKVLKRQVRGAAQGDASPNYVAGAQAGDHFVVMENGVRFELSFREGYSVGLFLDQRDNRRRLLTGHVAAKFGSLNANPQRASRDLKVLNLFSYTCAFSVCAAKTGAQTTSVDLSKKYLEWGKRNFLLNGLDPARHDFLYGDAFDWLRRLRKKARLFDVILIDPPTFSQSRERGAFRVEKDLQKFVLAALPLLQKEGVLFASSNAAGWAPEQFMEQIQAAVHFGKRKILASHYVPQPPDFPVAPAEPAHLKTIWMRVE